MLKHRIENSEVGNWNYERFVFQSAVLNQDVKCGVFRPKSKEKIHQTFYLAHGGGADDAQAVQAGLLPLLSGLLDQASEVNTQFVFPFVGNSFLHDHPTEKSKSFSKYFLEELVPACEAGTETRAESRFIGGWSMGGQAALNMFMRFPDKFAGVGVHFPTLIEFDYKDKIQQEAYKGRLKIDEDKLNILVSEFGREFVDPKDFFNHDPLSLAKSKAAAWGNQKKIYFDVGDEDEFGLQEGGKALHEILQQKKIAHQFELVPKGKHDGPFIHAQIPKMLRFLLL